MSESQRELGARADILIDRLGLQPHPEGGHFREIHRSRSSVSPGGGRADRAALTTIYFLLRRGERSRWHRLRSDEVWHYCEGDPLELVWTDPGLQEISRQSLGRLTEATQPVAIVPAESWQAARSLGEYTLVGCTVGPGFDFADFRTMEPDSAEASSLLSRHPELSVFL